MNGIYTTDSGAELVRRRYEVELESWPVSSERMRVSTSYGETFVLVCGPTDAPAVVLLHGSSANATNWLADAWSWASEFRLYAVDVLGEPGFSAPTRLALDDDSHARWLDEVLAALEVERVSMVGESLGGYLAVDYASRRADRVSRLALLCPGGLGKQQRGRVFAALLLMVFGTWGRRKAMNYICGTAEIPEFARDIQRNFRPRLGKLPLFGSPALRRLTMPVLAVVGQRDRMFDSRGTRRRLAESVPHADVVEVPDAGHLLPRQTATIGAFLRGQESANAAAPECDGPSRR